MAWQQLLADLEAEFEGQVQRELDSEIADRTRREQADIDVVARCCGAVGQSVTVRLLTGGAERGTIVDVGADWLALEERADAGPPRMTMVSLAAVTAIAGLGHRAEQSVLARRFRLGFALRGLSRDRAVVVITDVSGARITGTVAAVGSDWVDLTVHPIDELPRRHLHALVTIPRAAIVTVSSAS